MRVPLRDPVDVENEVGIRAFMHDAAGFAALFKHRWSDFIVHEISQSGQVVSLDSFAVPVEAPPPAALAGDDRERAAIAVEALIGAQAWAQLAPLLDGTTSEPVDVRAPDVKDDRTRLHALLRTLCPTVDSDTRDGPPEGEGGAAGARVIRVVVRRDAGAAGRAGAKRGRNEGGRSASAFSWPTERPPHLSFVLHKVNVDTGSAVRAMAQVLGMKEKSFAVAGSKDKRALTSQEVRAYHLEARRLCSLGGDPRTRGLWTGNYAYVKDSLRLGASKGNRFDLVLRLMPPLAENGAEASSHSLAITSSLPHVATRLSAFNSSGCTFVNYFGMQRFGEAHGPGATHKVGAAVAGRDWEGAVRCILAPRPAENGDRVDLEYAGREYFARTGDAAGALELWPGRGGGRASFSSTPEQRLLGVIAERQAAVKGKDRDGVLPPGAALSAITTLAPRARALYVHALQAAVWNVMASARLEGHKGCVMAGDLVLPGSEDIDEGGGDEEEVDAGEDSATALDTGAGAGAGAASNGAVEAAPAHQLSSGERQAAALPSVHCVTEEEAKRGVFSMAQVVMPLPGFGVVYPGLETCAHPAGLLRVAQALRSFGLLLPEQGGRNGELEAAVRAVFKPADQRFHFPGGYRRLLCTARAFQWRFISVAGPMADSQSGDVEVLRERTGSGRRGGQGGGGSSVVSEQGVHTASVDPPSQFAPLGPGVRVMQWPPSLPSEGVEGQGQACVQVTFTLPPGSYATMALREMTRGGART